MIILGRTSGSRRVLIRIEDARGPPGTNHVVVKVMRSRAVEESHGDGVIGALGC